jgi:hypothetical protein
MKQNIKIEKMLVLLLTAIMLVPLSTTLTGSVSTKGILYASHANAGGEMPMKVNNFTLSWTSPATGISIDYTCPVCYDVNNDGHMDIIYAGNAAGWSGLGRVICISGNGGSILWMYNLTRNVEGTRPIDLYDLKNDGRMEVIIPTYSGTVCLWAKNGTVMWMNGESGNEEQIAIVGRQSGCAFVFIDHPGNGNSTVPVWGHLAKCYGNNGTCVKRVPYWYPCHGGLVTGDVNGDGTPEIVGSGRGTSINPQGMGVQCWDLNLNLLWSRPTISCSSHCPVLIDVNGDGVLDVIVSRQMETNNSGIYCLRGTDGSNIPGHCKYSIPWLQVHETFPVYDLDGDGHLEMVSTVWDHKLTVTDLTTMHVEGNLTMSTGTCGKPPLIANVIGDASLEVIAATEVSAVSIFNKYYQRIDVINTPSESCQVQDIDNDGLNELILINCSVLGGNTRVQCYETLASAPSPLPRTWNGNYDDYKDRVGHYLPPVTVSEHKITLKSQWNMISFPCHDLISKSDITVRYAGNNYTWAQAVNNSYVLNATYGWNASQPQNYEIVDKMSFGRGYWFYAYHDLDFYIYSGTDGNRTDLKTEWNMMGLPHGTGVNCNSVLVVYNGQTYSWADAIANHIILSFVYGWDASLQNFVLATAFNPGNGYWMYAYHNCTLKLPAQMKSTELTERSATWSCPISIEVQGIKADTAFFGEATDAHDGTPADSYDVTKFPVQMTPYGRITFNDNLETPFGTLWNDFRHYPGTFKMWNLTIQWVPSSGSLPTTIIMRWGALSSTEYNHVSLTDSNGVILVSNMKITSSYTFACPAYTPQDFQIRCSVF